MDDGNLKHVAQSIARANERIIAWNSTQPPAGAPFTHVILYGDFDYQEGSKLKKLVKEQTGPNDKVLYISQPWTSAQASSGSVAASAEQLSMPGRLKRASGKIMSGLGGTTKDVNAEVNELWGKFQDIRFDAMPIQVKILGIWTALGKSYGRKVCVIGHRSGFVEGAGFIGIPAFYLNNERRDLEKQLGSQTDNKIVHAPGELLWGPVRMPKTDRLRELSDVMNTFIPVEALGEKKAKGILQVDKKYESELMSALFIFMCCDVVGFGIGPGRGTVQPGWTARVAMMHDQSGQDWLRERYDFANINGDGEVPLPTWTGYARDKWLEGVKAIEEYELELQRMGFITIE